MRNSMESCDNRTEKSRITTPDRTFRLRLVFLTFCAVLFFPPLSAAEKKIYTVAVVPQFPPLVIKRTWMPLIEQVSHVSGVRLQLKFYRSIPEFEDDFLKGSPDFVYLNPYHVIGAVKLQRYIPLLRDGQQQLNGIIVVRKDSAIGSVADLHGGKIAFPSPNAFAASLYLRALLTQKEKIRVSPRYVTTHSNVYRHVLLGKAAAGGGVNKTLDKEPAELRDLLRVIYRTPEAASHPLCAHPRVDRSVRESVSAAIIKLAESREGRELLEGVELTRPVRADYKRDYRRLELLGLERFAVRGGN